MDTVKKFLISPKVPAFLIVVALAFAFPQAAFAAPSPSSINVSTAKITDVFNGKVKTDTPDAPQSYHFTKSRGLTAYNVLGGPLWTNTRTVDWNIPKNNKKISSSMMTPDYSTKLPISPWKIKAKKQKNYYKKAKEHRWVAGDVASWAVDCKASVSFKASASKKPAKATADAKFKVSAKLGQYICMATVADIQKGDKKAKESYLYMRMQTSF